MANFTTADDKRIYDLMQELNPTTDWSLPIDLPGKIGASRITLLQLVNLLSGLGAKQDANAGTTNPDNTFGDVGDFYFKIPSDGSSLTMFKKVTSNSWSTVFNLPIGGGSTSTEFRRTFLIPAGTLATDGVLSLEGLTNEQGDQIIPDKPNSNVYDGSSGAVYRLDKTINGLETDEDGLTVRDVLVVLNGVEPVEPIELSLENTTGTYINYSINGGSFSVFNQGESININPGNSIIMALDPESTFIFSLKNQNGVITNTDGGSVLETTPHEWIIPLDSTTLEIISER